MKNCFADTYNAAAQAHFSSSLKRKKATRRNKRQHRAATNASPSILNSSSDGTSSLGRHTSLNLGLPS